jgi:hypothetical protein
MADYSDDDYLPDYDYDKDASCVTSCEAVLAGCMDEGSPTESCRMDHLECIDGCDRSTVVGC